MSQTTTREAILAAAVVEFSDHGFSGTRMERIAKRAERNKSLVYRYFQDKEGLFHAALQWQFQHRQALLDRIPGNLADVLGYWFSETVGNPDFMRMIQREALNDQGGPVVEQDFRIAYYQRQVEILCALQESGQVSRDFKPAFLFLALLALVVFPETFPQIARLATGMKSDSRRFHENWDGLLKTLVAHLAPR